MDKNNHQLVLIKRLLNRFYSISIKKEFWLLAIAGALIAFHFHLHLLKEIFSAEIYILWIAALAIVWKRRQKLNLESSLLATGCGIVILAWLVIRNLLVKYTVEDILNNFSPLLMTIGLCLLASDFRGVRQYWRELICVLLSVFPVGSLLQLPDITILDAKFTHFLLWYLSFDVSRQGSQVLLNGGGIDIYPGCSSISSILILLKISVVFLLIFPLVNYKKICLILSSVVISVSINGIRLCLLALLVVNKNQSDFEYWHGPAGAQIFSTIIILLFGWLCKWMLESEKSKEAKV